MKKFFCFLGVMFLLLPLFGTEVPVEKRVGYSGEFQVPYTGQINDFHLEGYVKATDVPQILDYQYKDQSGNTVWRVGGVSIYMDSHNPDRWILGIDYESDDHITLNDVMEFGYKISTRGYNAGYHTDNYWTKDSEKVGSAMARAGFEVYTNPGGTLMIKFQNDFDTTVEIQSLQFGVTATEVPLADMSPEGLGITGQVGNQSLYGSIAWEDYNQSITLTPGNSTDINLTEMNIVLQPTDFLQFRAVTFSRNWWGQSNNPN